MIVAKQGISKKKLITYLVIIVIMIIGNVVIYLRNSQSSSTSEAETVILNSLVTIDSTPNTATTQKPKTTQSALEHTLFNTLKKIGDWPVVPANTGKADPFAPFFSTP